MPARLAQQFHFARHIPLRQVFHRLALVVRRRFETAVQPAFDRLAASGAVLNPQIPKPIFTNRNHGVARIEGGWSFHFLGRSKRFSDFNFWTRPDQEGGDQLWQMNLHYMEYLAALGVQDSLFLMRSWIAHNPPFTAGGWRDAWNSYTVSIRIVAWLQRLAVSPEIAKPDIIGSLFGQIEFLTSHIERDIGGNHLIKNIKALIWASACFSGPSPDLWRNTGLRLLRDEMTRQILDDGFHYEKSPSYHCQVFADLLEIRRALTALGEEGQFFDPILERMGLAVAALTHPDGGPALFNDSGLTMACAPHDCLRVFQSIFGRPISCPADIAFTDAGYYVHRGPDIALFVDMGRIGPDDLPAHAHADVGSFELSVGGHRFVVDQGVFEYVDGDRRTLSRQTASHNCLVIDGRSQADLFGAFRCGRRPNVDVTDYVVRQTGFTLSGSHDGFAPHKLSRTFNVDHHHISIVDVISGPDFGTASFGLLLHPDCAVEIDGNVAKVSRAGRRIEISTTAALSVEPAVYWPDMGIEHQTTRLRLTLVADNRECETDIVIVQD